MDRTELMFVVGSAVSGFVTVIIGFVILQPKLSVVNFIIINRGLNNLIILTLISSTLVIAMYSEYSFRRMIHIQKELPTLFTNLAEGIASGMSIIESIEKVSRMDNPVGKACLECVKKFYIGADFWESVGILERRLGKFGSMVRSIIMAAYISGGNMEGVFENASRTYLEYHKYYTERVEKLGGIKLIPYMAFLTLLMITYIITHIFLGGVIGSQLNISQEMLRFYTSSFMWISIVISVTSPLITSKIIYGDVRPGVKNIPIMLAITYVFFNIILNINIEIPALI